MGARAGPVGQGAVGGDTITAERKYGAPFTFRPYARLLFSANEAPPSFDTSYAYFRRWLIVPFEAVFRGERKDKQLLAKLTTPAELSGLLSRALEGLQRLRQQGEFSHAKSLESAAQSFRTDVDSAAAFVAEECVLAPAYRARQADVYAAYKEWCERVNRSPLSARRFNPRVQSLLPDPQDALVTVDGWPSWKGIGLRADVGREQQAGDTPENVRVGHCQRCKAWTYLRGQLCSACGESRG